MKDIYIITGANGHLGSTIIRLLKKQLASHSSQIQEIRGLILPGEEPPFKEDRSIHWYYGDVTDIPSLVPLFENTKDCRIIVIHTAGILILPHLKSQKGCVLLMWMAQKIWLPRH